MGTEEEAGLARSGRDLKCPDCGAKNRADAGWCWQCLARFPESQPAPAERAPVEEPVPEVADRAGLTPEAMSELAGIASDDEMAARFSTLVGDDAIADPAAPGTVPNGLSSNGHGRSTALQDPPARATIAGERGVIEVKGEAITWTCSRCETVNSFDTNICEVCSASFAEVIKEPETGKVARDPNTVALVSLFFPGAGHAYLGMWGQAVARGVISIWVVATSIFAAIQGATQSMITAIVFGVVSFGLWLVSAHDAYREAQNRKSAVLLRDKWFLYLVMGLLLLSVIMVFSLATGARSA